ncbi:MAG: ThiF family adenylyltransferase [Pseudomonadota bacterium]
MSNRLGMNPFNYNEAFSRNLGWITSEEQSTLRSKRIAIAGMGGVGFDHMVRMARLGVANFTLSDLDVFEQVNFNRQYGATMSTVGQPKVDVAESVLRSINPEVDVRSLKDGVTEDNHDEFMADVDINNDSLDFFALDIRRAVFERCRELDA